MILEYFKTYIEITMTYFSLKWKIVLCFFSFVKVWTFYCFSLQELEIEALNSAYIWFEYGTEKDKIDLHALFDQLWPAGDELVTP